MWDGIFKPPTHRPVLKVDSMKPRHCTSVIGQGYVVPRNKTMRLLILGNFGNEKLADFKKLLCNFSTPNKLACVEVYVRL